MNSTKIYIAHVLSWVGLFLLHAHPALAATPKPGDLIRAIEFPEMSAESINFIREENNDQENGEETRYGIRAFRIIYYTKSIRGGLDTASGLAMFPVTQAPLPLLSMQHKAVGLRTSAPSFHAYKEESLTALLHFASKGYAVLQPDGLGLGRSSAKFNPFLHADTEASTGKNFIEAAQTFAKQKNFSLNGDLYLSGYSQGGHWTMAIQREIEKNPIPGLTLVASAPMGAPLDLSGTCLPVLLNNPGITSPIYAASLLYSYQEIYGDLFKTWNEAFQSPYDTRVPVLFDGTRNLLGIFLKLPKTPNLLIQPAYLDGIVNKPEHPFKKLLEKNNVYEWVPQVPTLLVHAVTDGTSPVQNSIKAAEYMSSRGAPVTLHLLKEKLSHSDAFFPAMEIARDYFQEIKVARAKRTRCN